MKAPNKALEALNRLLKTIPPSDDKKIVEDWIGPTVARRSAPVAVAADAPKEG